MIKIAITGPESSGKTTIATGLRNKYAGKLVPEYAREFLENKESGYQYSRSDLEQIATEQFQRNQAENCNFLIADTEMLVMHIWFTEKYGFASKLIDKLLKTQRFDHYFLCKPDFKWEYDPLRENPNDQMRLYHSYIDAIDKLGWEYTILSGSVKERIETSTLVIESMLGAK